MRFDTLKDLYNKIVSIESLKDKILLNDESIEIMFHKECVFSIKLNIYFNIYINNILCCKNIEDQDIWEVLHGYLDENNFFVEQYGFGGRRTINELNSKQFERQKDKIMRKQNVKIYTVKELIFQSN